jgi:cytochrome d ubiquinol oxidase subunit II
MSYVSLFIPVVLAYIIYSWRSINNKKIDENELKEDTHLY